MYVYILASFCVEVALYKHAHRHIKSRHGGGCGEYEPSTKDVSANIELLVPSDEFRRTSERDTRIQLGKETDARSDRNRGSEAVQLTGA